MRVLRWRMMRGMLYDWVVSRWVDGDRVIIEGEG